MALGELADRLSVLVVDADGDELRQSCARLVEHTERPIAGVDEIDGTRHDAPEHRWHVEVRTDRDDGVEQLVQALRTD